ncbi:cytochrome C oxidase subunit II [Thermus thermamylovorans]|uniref:cytochrome-c oxidase n=1 Tax=Thermus thermamylovorans TaxID=2509362 RepID=A0A4Q9B8D1_9DEIN|nr:cytochrome C oxidase subunit II [Thermus thermamylovorans]TBH21886.1 cytochrome C oxidase subunit II [Thermus thermamylovorans]
MTDREKQLHHILERYEKAWIGFALAMVLLFIAIIAFTLANHGLRGVVPVGELELVDPATVRFEGPWADPERAVVQTGPNQYTAHVLAFTFGYLPNPVVVPKGAEIVFKVTSPDVLHGFHIEGTNVNVEVLPGHVAIVRYTFREAGEYRIICNQYCGIGHHRMFGAVRVVEPEEFAALTGKAEVN